MITKRFFHWGMEIPLLSLNFNSKKKFDVGYFMSR